jgi:hypothetical protein
MCELKYGAVLTRNRELASNGAVDLNFIIEVETTIELERVVRLVAVLETTWFEDL